MYQKINKEIFLKALEEKQHNKSNEAAIAFFNYMKMLEHEGPSSEYVLEKMIEEFIQDWTEYELNNIVENFADAYHNSSEKFEKYGVLLNDYLGWVKAQTTVLVYKLGKTTMYLVKDFECIE